MQRSTGIEAGASDDLCQVGEIRIFAGDFAPRVYLFAHGQLLSIANNQALFSVIRTDYGGNGTTNFALPDLYDLEPGGTNYTICVKGIVPSLS